MPRRNPTLTILLTLAVLGALALLIDALVQEFGLPGTVELSERSRYAGETRQRPPRNSHASPPVSIDDPSPRVDPPTAPAGVAGNLKVQDGSTDPAIVVRAKISLPRGSVPVRAEHAKDRQASPIGTSLSYATGLRTVIATYLLQFANASEWPGNGPPPTAPFRIGVLRDEAFRDEAARVLKGEKVGAHAVTVLGGETPGDLAACALVFVSDAVNADDARTFFEQRPTMMVTYTASDLHDTWCEIEFIWLDGQLGFVVDREALQPKGITMKDAMFDFENAFVRSGGGPILRILDRKSPARQRVRLP